MYYWYNDSYDSEDEDDDDNSLDPIYNLSGSAPEPNIKTDFNVKYEHNDIWVTCDIHALSFSIPVGETNFFVLKWLAIKYKDSFLIVIHGILPPETYFYVVDIEKLCWFRVRMEKSDDYYCVPSEIYIKPECVVVKTDEGDFLYPSEPGDSVRNTQYILSTDCSIFRSEDRFKQYNANDIILPCTTKSARKQ